MAGSSIPHSDREAMLTRVTYGDQYRGSAERLVAAGVVKPGQFPGDLGRGKTSVSYDSCGQPMRRGQGKAAMRVRRAGRGSLFEVFIRVDEVEAERRRAAGDREDLDREDLDREVSESCKRLAPSTVPFSMDEARAELAKAEAELAELPAAQEAFGRAAADHLWLFIGTFQGCYMSNDEHKSGFRFNAQTRDEFSSVASALYYLVQKGEATFNMERRMKRVQAARAKVARLDASLQQFLANAQTLDLVPEPIGHAQADKTSGPWRAARRGNLCPRRDLDWSAEVRPRSRS